MASMQVDVANSIPNEKRPAIAPRLVIGVEGALLRAGFADQDDRQASSPEIRQDPPDSRIG